MPRFRFTIRGLMISVAVVAAGCGYIRLARDPVFGLVIASWIYGPWLASVIKRRRFVKRAARHRELARRSYRQTDTFGPDGRPTRRPRATPLSLYHIEMAEKYEFAARYPWLPVEPDPPEPE